ncbi:unnamed protein product [Adineta ricciae]|uniref:Arginine deiminase n=1 Tax=Adineta ricciae TaxID=249248 RepID=A0A814GIN0_ADIRI|nr:unnamed protein product [Adineta ricciae]
MLDEFDVGVQSECGKLDVVLMHRPGKELLCLSEHNLHQYLYDALPNINETHRSHDVFSQYLRGHDVHVLYLTDLLYETLDASAEARYQLINEIVDSQNQNASALQQWLLNRTPEQLTQDVIVGVACSQDDLGTSQHAQELLRTVHPSKEYLIQSLPNLLFVRDGFSIIEKNVFIWKMNKSSRRNEPVLLRTIFQHHPQLSTSGLKIIEWQTKSGENNNNDGEMPTIEGGDVAYIGDGTVMIGCSERTNRAGIEAVTRTGLFRQVIAIDIPHNRCYMHLDTILSSVGNGAFTLYGSLADSMEVFTLKKIGEEVKWISHGCKVRDALIKVLDNRDLVFYDAADKETSLNEQRNCRYNVVVIDRNHVVTYSGSDAKNGIVAQMTRNNACRVGEIPPQGLFEGGGGVHCMTNALRRRSVN